jgi:hypothetical protein
MPRLRFALRPAALLWFLFLAPAIRAEVGEGTRGIVSSTHTLATNQAGFSERE